MTVQEAYIHVTDRLNNLSTQTNAKISKRAFVLAFNKMQLHWFEERIKVRESDQVRQEELQQFIKEFNKPPYQKEDTLRIVLPDDYFRYTRVYGECGECAQTVRAYPKEEGNVNRLISNEFYKPSLNWEETFFTLRDNELLFYTDNFSCKTIHLIYYRCPKSIDMKDIDMEGYGSNINPELDKTSVHEVLDLVTRLLAADTSNPRYQTISNQIQQFN